MTAALLVAGCSKDEHCADCDGGLVKPKTTYAAPTSPQSVLFNMVLAYNERDSVQTALVYDDSYQGESIDPSGIVGNFSLTKGNEIRHVGRLKTDPNVVFVSADLGNPASWVRQPADLADPDDWAMIQINVASIRVGDLNATTYEVSNQSMAYTFAPTVAAPGDTTWKIVRWTEIVTNP